MSVYTSEAHEKWAKELLDAHKKASKITVISTATHSYNFGESKMPEKGVQAAKKRISTVVVYGGANSQGRSGNGFVLEARDSVGTLVDLSQLEIIVKNTVAFELASKGIISFESGKLHASDMSNHAKENMTAKDHNAPLDEKGLASGVAESFKAEEQDPAYKTERI